MVSKLKNEFLKKKRILILCALPYTNAIPHVGNIAGSHLPADIFARYCRLKGKNAVFIGGADENGTPTEIASIEMGVDPKTLTDKLFDIHKSVYDWLEISYDNFSRTSLPIHHKTTQDFFQQIYKNGYISEGNLRLPYCEHDKLFLPDRYVEGTCPYCGYENARGDQCDKCTKLLDPEQLLNLRCKVCGTTPIIKETRHLFLELDKLQPKVEKWIKSNKQWRQQVKSLALGWIKEGLKKRCITRDLKWGVKVPIKGYENKIFYVWFDAPIGYVSSTKEWAEKIGKPKEWERFWKGKDALIYNILGKDNIPFHTIFWPAMQIANGKLNLSYDVIGLQYVNYEGGKISKSRKWGVFCENLDKSGVAPDVWRYYFSWLIPETRDTEFKWKEFQDRTNNELVGNLANFVHRTLTFAYNNFGGKIKKQKLNKSDKKFLEHVFDLADEADKNLSQVRLRDALSKILEIAAEGNKYFQKNEPWKLVKEDRKRCEEVLFLCVNVCKVLGILINPYLPATSQKILSYLNIQSKSFDDAKKAISKNIKINEPHILFEKIDDKKLEDVKEIVTKVTDLKSYFKIGGDSVKVESVKQTMTIKKPAEVKTAIKTSSEISKPIAASQPEISYEEFSRLDLRIAEIKSAEDVKGSDKLLKLRIDIGGQEKTIIAGIKGVYAPENLKGKQIVVVNNLAPREYKQFGVTSQAMLLAADDGKPVLLQPDKKVKTGSRIK